MCVTTNNGVLGPGLVTDSRSTQVRIWEEDGGLSLSEVNMGSERTLRDTTNESLLTVRGDRGNYYPPFVTDLDPVHYSIQEMKSIRFLSLYDPSVSV